MEKEEGSQITPPVNPSARRASAEEALERIKRWSIDSAATLVPVLIVSVIFDHLVSREDLERLVVIQLHFHKAVSAFSPGRMWDHPGAFWWPFFLSGGVLDLIARRVGAMSPYGLIDPSKEPWWLACLCFAWSIAKVLLIPIAIPVVIASTPIVAAIDMFATGNALDGAFIVVLWPFLLWWAIRLALKKTDKWSAIAWYSLWANLALVGLLWAVKASMVFADVVFGQVIATAQLVAGGSTLAWGLYWCSAKGTEHSVTERVIDMVKRRLTRYGLMR